MKRWLLGKFGWYVAIVAVVLIVTDSPKDTASLNGTAVDAAATSAGIVAGGIREAGPSFKDGMSLMEKKPAKKSDQG